MTKEELGQYKALKMEINMLHKRIVKLKSDQKRMEHDVVKGSNQEFPYQPVRYHVSGYNPAYEGKTTVRLELLREVLEKKKEDCEKQLLKIQEYINEIPDSTLRVIFTYRYVEGLSWQATAFRIGEGDESYPRKKHDKYLKLAENA